MAFIGRLTFPITQGIEALRAILLHGRSLADLQIQWGLGWLLIQPLLLLALGIAFFAAAEHVALRRGTLGSH